MSNDTVPVPNKYICYLVNFLSSLKLFLGVKSLAILLILLLFAIIFNAISSLLKISSLISIAFKKILNGFSFYFIYCKSSFYPIV